MDNFFNFEKEIIYVKISFSWKIRMVICVIVNKFLKYLIIILELNRLIKCF